MKETKLPARDFEQAKYAEFMAEALRNLNPKPRPKPEDVKQAPSTQRILERDPSKDEEWFNRTLDIKAAQVVEKVEDMPKTHRIMDVEQHDVYKSMQRASKNTLGQSEKSAFGEEKREAAINAYVYSPPAEITPEDKQRITQIAGYEKLPPLPLEDKKESERKDLSFFGLLERLLSKGKKK